jgi:serine/threonine protein kinase
MSGLLIMDPKDRLTAKQALMHPYFDGLRTCAEEE